MFVVVVVVVVVVCAIFFRHVKESYELAEQCCLAVVVLALFIFSFGANALLLALKFLPETRF